MICQGPFLAPSQQCQTVCLQKGVWTYSTLYPCWRKMHHLFTQGSKKGHSQTSLPCKSRMCFCDWSSRDWFGPPHLFQCHTSYIRVLEAEKDLRTWQCEKRYCQNKSMKTYAVESLLRMLSATRTNCFPWIGTDAHGAWNWCPGALLESQGRGVQPVSTWPSAELEPRSACLLPLIVS